MCFAGNRADLLQRIGENRFQLCAFTLAHSGSHEAGEPELCTVQKLGHAEAGTKISREYMKNRWLQPNS
jgi:hypothetical protein